MGSSAVASSVSSPQFVQFCLCHASQTTGDQQQLVPAAVVSSRSRCSSGRCHTSIPSSPSLINASIWSSDNPVCSYGSHHTGMGDQNHTARSLAAATTS